MSQSLVGAPDRGVQGAPKLSAAGGEGTGGRRSPWGDGGEVTWRSPKWQWVKSNHQVAVGTFLIGQWSIFMADPGLLGGSGRLGKDTDTYCHR